ncbi:hypothetical protein PPO43_11010 [Saprospira sp. CCB-QB6]|uniref:hypothetical protein n=1 Tax=Saprospira sp. CCB-QB6 TaxID=3023936 RepID=UPI0023497BCC|nr:hypothetical protein [Saprospira sp. CCB-QB6]WCL80496.1 hypothetical protein PPO43_11010 [Saprospira sp. CCB-QB6]
MNILAIVILLALLAVAGIFFLLRFLRNVQPDEGELEEDLASLKAAIADFKGGFVPWSQGISAKEVDQVVEKSNQREGKGVFLSPEGDPVFAYAFRSYIGPGKNNLIYVLTLEHEYIFRTTTKGTQIQRDGRLVGLLRANGQLVDERNRDIGRLERRNAISESRFYLQEENSERELAKIALPDNLGKMEAIEITGMISAEQEQQLKAVASYELVHNLGLFA